MSQRQRDAQLSLPVLDWAGVEDQMRPAERAFASALPPAHRKARPSGGGHVSSVATQPSDDGDELGGVVAERLLLTVPEAAHALHIGRRQAWEMVWRGELPVVRLGRSVRIARPILERFVADQSLPYGA